MVNFAPDGLVSFFRNNLDDLAILNKLTQQKRDKGEKIDELLVKADYDQDGVLDSFYPDKELLKEYASKTLSLARTSSGGLVKEVNYEILQAFEVIKEDGQFANGYSVLIVDEKDHSINTNPKAQEINNPNNALNSEILEFQRKFNTTFKDNINDGSILALSENGIINSETMVAKSFLESLNGKNLFQVFETINKADSTHFGSLSKDKRNFSNSVKQFQILFNLKNNTQSIKVDGTIGIETQKAIILELANKVNSQPAPEVNSQPAPEVNSQPAPLDIKDLEKRTSTTISSMFNNSEFSNSEDKSNQFANVILDEMKINGLPINTKHIALVLVQISRESSFLTDPLSPDMKEMFTAYKDQLDAKIKKLYAQVPLVPDSIKNYYFNFIVDGSSKFLDYLWEEYDFANVKTEGDIDRKWKILQGDRSKLIDKFKGFMPTEVRPWIPEGEIAKLIDTSPIKTVGVMQVDVEVAQDLARSDGKIIDKESMRKELYTLRGGLHYGIKILANTHKIYSRPGILQEEQMKFTVADYNAGAYSSRNAAFQRAVKTILSTDLQLDGDLLNYDKNNNPVPLDQPGQTEKAIRLLLTNNFTENQIREALLNEKNEKFEESFVYKAINNLYKEKTGSNMPFAIVPDAQGDKEVTNVKFGKGKISSKGYVEGSLSWIAQTEQSLIG